MSAAVILVDAQPRQAVDAVAQTARLAGGGALQPYHYDGHSDWRAGIEALPTIVTGLDFDGDDIGTGGVPQAAELVWKPASQASIDAMAAYFWIDAPIVVRIGPESDVGALPPVAIAGTVLEAVTEPGLLRLRLSDPAATLKKPLLGAHDYARYLGTGGLQGPAEWEGLLRRRIWGRVWNSKGDLIDKANNVFCFADPLRPIFWFDAVRDSGAPAASLTYLGWQGSAAATFAALQAAAAPQGSGVFAPSIACLKWWTQPAGDLTADLRGEVAGGYVETSAEIAAALVAEVAGPGFAPGTIAAAKALRPAPVGWVAKDDSTTVASMIEQLLGNVSLLWVLETSGTIRIREWSWDGEVAASATSHQAVRKRVFRPVITRKIGYKRNELPMARGDLAGIVLASDIALPGGDSLQDTLASTAAQAAAAAADAANASAAAVAAAAAAAAASTAADAATDEAHAALADLADLADDSVLTRNEKITRLIPDENRLYGKWQVLNDQAYSIGVSNHDAQAALFAWHDLLNALHPAWNDTSQDSPVNRANFTTALSNLDGALYQLDKSIKAKAATLAAWAGVSGVGKPDDYATVGAPGSAPVGSITGNDVSSTINPGGGVASGQVSTAAIVPYAVTRAGFMRLASDVALPRAPTNVISYSISKTEAASAVQVAANIRLVSAGDLVGGFTVQRDGQALDQIGVYLKGAGANIALTFPVSFLDTSAGAGGHQYDILFERTDSSSGVKALAGSNLIITEIKR